MKKLVDGVDHVAMIVKSLNESLPFYTEQLGLEVVHRETVESEGIHVALVDVGNTVIELMEPYDENCYVARMLKKHGQGLAHICFSTQDIEGLTERMKNSNMFLLGDVRNGAEGRRVIFLHPKDNSGVLTEFSQITVTSEES